MSDLLPARNRPRVSRGVPRETFLRLLELETDECVLWPHARDAKGYGRLNFRGKTESAHSLACELRHGPRPLMKEAAHYCGVPACMNYRHLRWATQSENMQDRVIHGTSNRGERSGSQRLTVEDVRQVRRRCAAGETDAAIAATYGVHPATIQAVRVRRSWFWLK
jgi:hypothetical protein